MIVVARAMSASISSITLAKRGTRRLCNHTTIGFRTIATRNTRAKNKITGCNARRISHMINRKKINHTMREAP